VSRRVLGLFHDVADRIGELLAAAADWGPSGRRDGQYAIDLVTDGAAVAMLHGAGFAVLSEESGRTEPPGGDAAGVVVIDPLDGSTNASRGIPWFATALCLVDDAGPAAALVANQASGERFAAVRREGAWRGSGRAAGPAGGRLQPSGCARLDSAIVGISGAPLGGGWAQFRAFGASALDLCLVAAGTLDGFVDMSSDAHGVWDYLGASLICAEAGVPIVDAAGRDLVVLDHVARRTPVAAATPELLDALLAIRRS
jgi:fructose-1,6-bisphosphatase/inositol monophosphatase family enzyme